MLAYNTKLITTTLLVLSLGLICETINAYVIPTPNFERLQRGIRVSIPDEEGVRLFGFHGNVNRRITTSDHGELSGDVYKAINGRWTFEDHRIELQNNDVIYYWIYVQVNGVPYRGDNYSWTVSTDVGTQTDDSTRIPSVTPASTQGRLLLDENFDALNESLWSREIKIPMAPDYEFSVYHDKNHQQVLNFNDGKMYMKPILLDDHYGENATMFGRIQLAKKWQKSSRNMKLNLEKNLENWCTSNVVAECTRHALAYSILPPIISVRLTTKERFSFRYGKVEVRAKFPEGDWLYPEMWLQPRYSTYGSDYNSGLILLGMARGNENFVKVNNVSEIYDSRKVEFGVRTGSSNGIHDDIVSRVNENGPRWTHDFHVYTTIWNEDGFTFLVDDQQVGHLTAATRNWLHSDSAANTARKGAPFDQEFYITLGVGVGGVRVFPDGTTSSGFPKPWKNLGAKAMLKFWTAKDQWLPTWRKSNGAKTAFEIDYVRVWSLCMSEKQSNFDRKFYTKKPNNLYNVY